MFLVSDARLALLTLLGGGALLLVLFFALRALGYDLRQALSAAERRVLLKVLALFGLVFLLLLRLIYLDLPAELFIYGRF